jgi:putative ABC transport system substrate-binding protein
VNHFLEACRLFSAIIAVVAVLIFAAPSSAGAQQAGKIHRISFLGLTPGEDTTSMKPLLERLRKLSYSEGRNSFIEIGGKQLQLLQELAPGKHVIAVLMNPDTPYTRLALKEINTAAEATPTRVHVLEARTPDQVPRQFEAAIAAGAGGLLVIADPLTYSLRRQISDLAAKVRLPAMYPGRDYAEAGGLLSYGIDRRQIYRRAAEYVDRILKGAKPGDLPIEQPTKFELIINLRTAKALGLTIPPSLLVRADEVIE